MLSLEAVKLNIGTCDFFYWLHNMLTYGHTQSCLGIFLGQDIFISPDARCYNPGSGEIEGYLASSEQHCRSCPSWPGGAESFVTPASFWSLLWVPLPSCLVSWPLGQRCHSLTIGFGASCSPSQTSNGRVTFLDCSGLTVLHSNPTVC